MAQTRMDYVWDLWQLKRFCDTPVSPRALSVLTQESTLHVSQIKHEHQIDLRIKDPLSLYLKASCSKQMSFSKEQNVETLIPTLIGLFK
jgi:hypothetical protein